MVVIQVPLIDNWISDTWPYTQFRKTTSLTLYNDERNRVSHGGLSRIGRPALPANVAIQSAYLVFDVTDKSNSNVLLEIEQIISNLSNADGNFTVQTGGAVTAMRFTPPIGTGEYRVNFASFMSRDFTGVSYIIRDVRTGIDPSGVLSIQPKFIEITYDFVPNAPNLTSPNGGETLAGATEIKWTPPTVVTAPNSELSYEVQYSGNNGQTWSTIANTAIGVTNYTHDFYLLPETNLGKIRIRAKHGSTFGAWAESAGVFTIRHNTSPPAPTNLVPNGNIVDRTITNKLSWQHNDSPNDPQSKADLRWRLQGSLNWINIVVNGPLQETYVTTDTFPFGPIEWQVRTYDQSGLVSPWSNIAVFTSAAPTNLPIINKPGATVNVSRPVVEWAGGTQQSYQVVVDDALNRQVWSSGEVFSANKAVTIGIDLVNGATYKIKVRIKDGGGLFSSFAEKIVQVSYTPPVKPTVQLYKIPSGVRFDITNPTPTGSAPHVTDNEIYKKIGYEWIRIAYNLNTTYSDYALKSEEFAEYRIRAIGANGAISESDVINVVAPKLRGVWLHDTRDPELSIHQFLYNGGSRVDSYQIEHAYRKFAGRRQPTVEFGTHADYNVSVNLDMLKKDTDSQKLNDFVRSGATLLYRDGRGRKLYCVFPTISLEDVSYGNSVKLNIVEIDYDEEV